MDIAQIVRTLLTELHPKVKSAAQIAAVLVVVDAIVVAVSPHVPAGVLAVLVALHAVLPVVAGYLKSDASVAE
jgi:hypothetical protein